MTWIITPIAQTIYIPDTEISTLNISNVGTTQSIHYFHQLHELVDGLYDLKGFDMTTDLIL